MPMISLLLGNAINNFSPNISKADLTPRIHDLVIRFILAGIGIFVGSFMMVFFWSIVGRRLIIKINEEYFRILMKQEQGYFDQSNAYEFATKVQYQTKIIENGVINYFTIR
jgi:ABC-type bacteriocin/lantibiotic exporter with double-glycine peptidase domain